MFERFSVIDADTHVTEPRDTWTRAGLHANGERPSRGSSGSTASTSGSSPASRGPSPAIRPWPVLTGCCRTGRPPTRTCTPRRTTPKARIAFMDEQDIYAQVLYPNIGGFGGGSWLGYGDPAFALECVQAYNDFQVDFASVAPDRLLPDRVAAVLGHRGFAWPRSSAASPTGTAGINFCNQPEAFDQPRAVGPALGPDLLHGAGRRGPGQFPHRGRTYRRAAVQGLPRWDGARTSAEASSMLFVDNLRCIADLIHGGVCHRFPNLKFVSVESGVSMLPGALESFDWQWRNGGVVRGAPRVRPAALGVLPPSDLRLLLVRARDHHHTAARLSRQHAFRDRLPAPHLPASGSPHPGGRPGEVRRPRRSDRCPEEVLQKVLVDNAAALYGVTFAA